jgi:hypothetical protein
MMLLFQPLAPSIVAHAVSREERGAGKCRLMALS